MRIIEWTLIEGSIPIKEVWEATINQKNDLMHVWFCSKIDLTKKWAERYNFVVKITFRLKSKKKKKNYQGEKKLSHPQPKYPRGIRKQSDI